MRKICGIVLALLIALAAFAPASAQAERPVVRAVMFWTGGIGYPNLPGLAAYLPAGAVVAGETDQPLSAVKFGAPAQADPQEGGAASSGFGLATAIMVVLGLALLYALAATVQVGRGAFLPMTPEWADNLIPLLSVLGLGVAVYLTYVETQQIAAVCGPVGDCNAVQSSPYAYLFGVIPVGLMGAFGYVALLGAWAFGRFGRGAVAQMAPLALFGMALFGVLFCMYLTYLELAIIRAVCIWCLSVAITMALILVLSVGSAMAVLAPAGDEDAEESGQPV